MIAMSMTEEVLYRTAHDEKTMPRRRHFYRPPSRRQPLGHAHDRAAHPRLLIAHRPRRTASGIYHAAENAESLIAGEFR